MERENTGYKNEIKKKVVKRIQEGVTRKWISLEERKTVIFGLKKPNKTKAHERNKDIKEF